MDEEGEKKWWKKCRGLIIFLTVFFLLGEGLQTCNAEGNVGCQFVKSLCLEEIEFCYDDLVFGKCVPKGGIESELNTARHTLTEEQSGVMATMLEELQGAGLGWDHPFVQCKIQGTLFSMRRNTPLPPNLCANLAPDPEILDPQSPLAFVRFIPPNDDYAEEVYYPPFKKGFDDRFYNQQSFLVPSPVPPAHSPKHNSIDTLSKYIQSPPPSRSELLSSPFLTAEEQEKAFEERLENQEVINRIRDMEDRLKMRRLINEYEEERLRPQQNMFTGMDDMYPEDFLINNEDMSNYPGNHLYRGTYKRTNGGIQSNKFESNVENDLDAEQNDELSSTYFREIAKSKHIPLNVESEYFSHYKSDPLESLLPISRVPKEEDVPLEDDNDHFLMNTYPRKYPFKKGSLPEKSGMYTEGGLVYVPERQRDHEGFDKSAETRDLLNMLGFTRHERLDVKKPGPLVGPPPSVSNISENPKEISATNKEVLPVHIKGDDVPRNKKVMRDHSDDEHAPHSVDTDYAYVILKQPLDNWNDGARIVSALADILHMQNYFTHPRIDRHEVSFRVEENAEKKTATDVARSINDPRFKNNISRRLGVTVLSAGVGNKIKSDPDAVSASRIEIAESGPDVTHIMAYMFAGAGAAAVVVIVITLFLLKRQDRKRDKLGGLQAGLSGTESCSKDYQELCRARMAGKGTASSDTIAGGRITSLSKENDRPPSSRSSTSSWSEEPALTNMDISTGHMVLSYMEDHLRNKGRLQREWEALCRYEAEPSARDAALQTQCASLNRPGAPLPFDHSRVVLNHLANAEGLDYINASTITDHDPRAPAYVAAQGPLPTTLAHFWQMIWEQGAVVIVALCRLQENGEIACARYWPEEGAEVYHIYEVHLVSEHIWCDDYLVRSFYLKNLRTSETRTVTQFHFLSWPPGGVPSSAKALLEFRRKVNKSYRGRSCPIVVHGSTGAGRTGAYILLDLVLGRMNKGAREIDIAATLEHLRDQRAGLVATRQQFEFVLMAVAEEVHAILKALPANQGEKREQQLDKETVKEEETPAESKEVQKQPEKPEQQQQKAKQEKSKDKKDEK